ncbi:MAG: acetyl-CoA hydrolase/transferase family protein [Chloroflexi bacterium]|nr:acetyl-CoA hydrolase/transferase family protein [Chloroflexota bacterium]
MSKKSVSAREAVRVVRSGHTVVLGSGWGEPQTLVEALVEDHERLENVRLITMLPAGACNYALPEMSKHFKVCAFVAGAGLLDAVRAGRVDCIPCHLSEIPRLFTRGHVAVDVAFVQLSPPDPQGYCTFGIAVDYTKAAAHSARVLVAEINDQMPRVLGDCLIHVSEIDLIVESSRSLPTLPPTLEIGEVEVAIGRLVADMVPDGATIEVGVGAIPDAVLRCLRDRRGLSIHTGILTDGVLDLVKAGAIRRAAIDGRSPIVATIVGGSQQLLDFVRENEMVSLHPADFTHDVGVLSQIENLICVNSALQVDLTGQVNAEVIGGWQVSGVGGQVDFTRGASRAPGGKSIIALPSTASGGKVSRIVSHLGERAVVTTPRTDVHYVVTEHGVANLRGLSLRERKEALIRIAHPDFRGALEQGL